MLTIRLTRVGKKNSPAYRVVVADKKRAVKRKFIEILGNYNPTTQPKSIVISKERALFWMGNGAQPSDTVRNLMADLGILDKKEKTQKVFGKKWSKKAIKEGLDKKPEVKEEPKAEVAEETSEVAPAEVVETAPAEETAEAEAIPATEASTEETAETKE